MLALKVVVTTIIAIVCLIILASAVVSKNKQTNVTVFVLILTYLLAIFCMWA